MSTRAMKLQALSIAHLKMTRNALPSDVRHASIERLNRGVIEAIDLALAAKHAHWNVRGPSFAALHPLFDRVATDLLAQADLLAERAAALGGIARATVQSVASETTQRPYPILITSEQEHLAALADRLGRLSGTIRDAIGGGDAAGDPVTIDVLVGACRTFDRLLWLIEGHLVTDHPTPQ